MKSKTSTILFAAVAIFSVAALASGKTELCVGALFVSVIGLFINVFTEE